MSTPIWVCCSSLFSWRATLSASVLIVFKIPWKNRSRIKDPKARSRFLTGVSSETGSSTQTQTVNSIVIGHFRVPKTLTFKIGPSAKTIICKWVLLAWEVLHCHIISKAELLTSFLCRDSGELGNSLLYLWWRNGFRNIEETKMHLVKEWGAQKHPRKTGNKCMLMLAAVGRVCLVPVPLWSS